jgi:hypothetical protein
MRAAHGSCGRRCGAVEHAFVEEDVKQEPSDAGQKLNDGGEHADELDQPHYD